MERHSGTYCFAGITVRIVSLYNDIHSYCREYRCIGKPEILVRIDDSDIARERTCNDCVYQDGYLETLAVYRKLAEIMPCYGTLLIHGSCMAVDKNGILLCAPSGTGKSTHARMWSELLGSRVCMINDDKPLVHVGHLGATAFGTPWDGKHHLSKNAGVLLRAICLINRSLVNSVESLTPPMVYHELLQQVYRPSDPIILDLVLTLFDQLIEMVDLYRISCTPDIEAARMAFSALKGEIDEA